MPALLSTLGELTVSSPRWLLHEPVLPMFCLCPPNPHLFDQLSGKREKALDLFEDAAVAQEEVYGELSPTYISTLTSLAWLCGSQGRSERAKELFEKCLRLREETVGKEHVAYAHALNKCVPVSFRWVLAPGYPS